MSPGEVSVIKISEIPVFNFAVVAVNSSSEAVPAPFVIVVSAPCLNSAYKTANQSTGCHLFVGEPDHFRTSLLLGLGAFTSSKSSTSRTTTPVCPLTESTDPALANRLLTVIFLLVPAVPPVSSPTSTICSTSALSVVTKGVKSVTFVDII